MIGCVELNPRPPKVDLPALEKRMGDLAVDVRAIHTKAQLERQAFSDRLNQLAVDTARNIQTLRNLSAMADNRIPALEWALIAANIIIF